MDDPIIDCRLALHRWLNRHKQLPSGQLGGKKNLAKLESTAARRMGASRGKHDHQMANG